MSLTKVTYSMIDAKIANVVDFGADPTGVADSTAAIQAALNAELNVYIPPSTSVAFKITAPLTIRNGTTIYMDGARITSTVAGIFRLPSGGRSTIYAANAVLQTDTTTAGAAIALASGATTVTESRIYGFPLIIQANNLVDNASRGIDMRGFYRSYLEVAVSNFYYGVYADGDAGATFATYYNVLMKPDIRCGQQGYAIWLTNLCNAFTIVGVNINGGGVGYGGIVIEDSGANSIVGGYLENFAANASSFGISLIDSSAVNISGVTLDQSAGDLTANYALKLLGTTDGCSIINPQFAGSWNDTTRLLLNTASGKNSFIGNGYTNVFALGQTGASLTSEGAFLGQTTITTTSGSVTYPSAKTFRANEGLLVENYVEVGGSPTLYPGFYIGTGSPEGVYAAVAGSIYLRKDGSAGTSFYVKESGTGNTGWVAK